MRIRVRFPDGASHVVNDLSAECSYAELVSAISEASVRGDVVGARILRVNAPGTPSDVVVVGAAGVCVPTVKTGDTLRVEPAAAAAAAARRTAGSAWTRGRGRGRGGANTGNIRTLASVRSRPRRSRAARDADFDDPRDISYDPDADAEPALKRRAPKRARRGRGHVLGDGSAPSLREPSKARKRASVADAVPTPLDATAALGVTLAQAAEGADGSVMTSFRNALSAALDDRQKEALGERRFAAALAKSVEFTQVANGAAFTVRFRVRGEREWTSDGMHPTYSREHIIAGIGEIVNEKGEEGDKGRERLRARTMAQVSPRVFWNMVRLFPDGIEEGLVQLFPETDWTFLGSRRRGLSAKAKANLANRTYVFEDDE